MRKIGKNIATGLMVTALFAASANASWKGYAENSKVTISSY